MIEHIPYYRNTESATAISFERLEVGLAHFLVSDAIRKDTSTGTRHFLVSAFYPALPAGGSSARLSDLFGGIASSEFARQMSLPIEAVQQLQAFTESIALECSNDAAFLPQATNCPVLIYYPGGQSHRLSNAILCRKLAQLGYVVLTLDAPRDAPFVAFPDGHVVGQGMLQDECYIWPRIADIRCLLDVLPDLQSSGLLKGKLDLQKIGMVGHSRGGYLSNIMAVDDERVSAAVNMDGFLWGYYAPGKTGLEKHSTEFQEKVKTTDKPLLRLCGEQSSVENALAQFQSEANDWRGNLTYCSLIGFQHGTFGSIPWLNGELKNLKQSIQQPQPSQQILNLPAAIVGEFFDGHFNDRDIVIPAKVRPQVQAYFAK